MTRETNKKGREEQISAELAVSVGGRVVVVSIGRAGRIGWWFAQSLLCPSPDKHKHGAQVPGTSGATCFGDPTTSHPLFIALF